MPKTTEIEKTRLALVKAMQYVKEGYLEWPCCNNPFGKQRDTDGPHAPYCKIASRMRQSRERANAS